MRVMIAFASAAALLSALPAHAAAGASSGKTNSTRVVCKSQMKTGTRFAKRVCRTAAEWERIAEQNRADLKETVDRPQIEIRRGN